MRLFCALFGHKWYSHLVAGESNEPAEDKCSRCGVTVQVPGYCRCLHPCDCSLVELNGHRIYMNMPRRFIYQEKDS